ncbi:MAG: putative 4-hydroxybenzoate polyprenyltransferase [Armatimonadetes bacterium]|nr:putative 4-hydroxybenzoate polyprenyltransferase [Armatimonadota bacterium]
MATTLRGFKAFRTYLEMIKFEHSIFALPFAMIGMMWGSRAATDSAWPGWGIFGAIVLAMVSCRSAAMAFNRILDREIDAKNPRTLVRAIPAGLLSLQDVNLFFLGSCSLFLFASGMLGRLPLLLSPIALGVTLFYSATKRFTPLCHIILGISLGIAPAAAWIGACGKLDLAILPIVFAVVGWTAGFDIIYSLQDEEFDRAEGLRSIPETLGKARALTISRLLHAFAIVMLILAGFTVHVGALYFVGVAFSAAVLVYEQTLVKPDDLSRVNMAFFTLNGFVSLGLFAFALLDQIFSRK